MKLFASYRSYLPAFMTGAGAIMISVGLFFGQGQPLDKNFQWLRLAGAVIAAIGAFWSGHRQTMSAAENRERANKIIELTEQLHGHTTGGNSFCHGYPYFNSSAEGFQWMFIHSGPYPLIDVSVRIHNLERVNGQMDFGGPTIQLGTLFPGRAHNSKATFTGPRKPSHGYNLFFLARNGSWTQEIRWVELPNVIAVANRVVRDGMTRDQPLLLDISPEFPSPLPKDDDWTEPPPYHKDVTR